MKEMQEVLHHLKVRGARFADIRHQTTRIEQIQTEDRRVDQVSDTTLGGYGIRVLYENGWGFAATQSHNPSDLKLAAERALEVAKFANRSALQTIELAEEPRHEATFTSPREIDPFTRPLENKVTPLLQANELILKQADIIKAHSYLVTRQNLRRYANSEGSLIQSDHLISASEMTAMAKTNGEVKSRSYRPSPCAQGFEYFQQAALLDHAERIAREARDHCFAKAVTCDQTTLILDHENLALTMHESVGHPTELDRVLGHEESLAGRSFATTEKLGNFQYGSPIVNFVADNTLEHGLATLGFDDEGVQCQKWDIIRDGILVGYGANRELASKIGLKRASGTTRATFYHDVPIVRIPNLYLAPGKARLSLAELIADTKEGIYIQGRGSFSIDQMRLNMQFGGDLFWEIRDGKIVGLLKNVIYQAKSYEFWRSCDAICDERFFQTHGVTNCGKGDPGQVAQMTHGAAPARFRNIRIQGVKR